MFSPKVVQFYGLFLALVLSQIGLGENSVTNTKWIRHNQRVELFVCREPQARSIRFEELAEDRIAIKAVDTQHVPNAFNRMLETISDMCPRDLLNSFSVYPTETILHRCQQSGACKGRKGCLPTKMDEIKLIFAVTSFDVDPTVRYVEVITTNHTACACQNIKDKPKK
ncbi:hypothetical protein WA026_021021 [Henosepilachna vigintioctopunctata]|uniref:Platelet-derived growth factor (PDGF) family profile domain-containing protein n=1 Tax=Henosepilachna vigintioctopunctata TaxID=420089 RepID=A0AAW1VGD7_9CUCU